jgi:hypothetical protein
MSFSDETVLTKEMFQFQLPATNTISMLGSKCRAFTTLVLLGCTSIFGYKEDND